MHAPSLKPALPLATLFCLFLTLLLTSCTGKLEFVAGTAVSDGVEQRQALPVPEHTAHAPGIAWNQLGARVAEQNPAMAGSVEPVQGGALLTSPVQRLEGTVTLQGLRIESTAEGREGGFALQAVRLGRDDVMTAVSDGLNVEIDSSLARLIRTDVTEEFSTSADGIRQDFLLHASPAGTGQVRLELALSGATVEPSPHGARIILTDSGRTLAYHRLLVLDALDRELPARMEVASPNLLALVVDDTNAAYPIRIDPTFSDENWVSMGQEPGMNSSVSALAIAGDGTLYAGGGFTTAGGVAANRIAKWNGTEWSALGTGMNNSVSVLAIDGTGNLYAGGWFTTAGGVTVNRIAKWNGTEWSALGTGMDNLVRALAVDGTGNLYVGGFFTTAGGVAVNRIAKWNGTEWSALGLGMNNDVRTLTIDGTGNLYAGGLFTTAGGVTVNRIAKWNGTEWSAFGTGMNNSVFALAVGPSGSLYVGGAFTQAGGNPASYIAKWDGSAWSALGTGTNNAVNALAFDSGTLYAGGAFTQAGGDLVNRIAKWDGNAWNALGSGMNNSVSALAIDEAGNLYAGGGFGTAGGVTALRIAEWDGNSWSALGSGMNHGVYALAMDGAGNLYAGGAFTTAGGKPINRIAMWDGSQWSALGTGIDHYVMALAVGPSGNLYAGGWFSEAGGQPANYIAKWDGTAWSALGLGVNGGVEALVVDSMGNLYAGGYFTEAGGVEAISVAKWDGDAWSPLSLGMAEWEPVLALAVDSADNLYAGGNFTTAGEVTVNNIAKWNGTTWSPLSEGVNGDVIAIDFDSNGNLYVGGCFTFAGGVSANRIAKWDGTAWSALGSGVNDCVWALTIDDDDNLYTGGWFTAAGGATANYIAQWNGSDWKTLGSGMKGESPYVLALTVDRNNSRLFAGGGFKMAGDKPSSYIAYANLPAGGTGSLQVTIEPEGARTAGAQWRRVGTSTWRDSGTTEADLPAGAHVVEFKAVNGWFKPAEAHATITSGGTTQVTGTYTQFQPFPDTGQTKCYNNSTEITCPSPVQDFYGQDAQYQPRLPRSYTKLGTNEVELAVEDAHVDDGGPWMMTRDNVTGLVWEIKTNANKDDTYMWQDAQDVFIAGLNTGGGYGGFTDWRLPSVEELSTLVDAGIFNPSIDPFYFPNSVLSNYWSSTTLASYTNFAWRVGFNLGIVAPHIMSGSHYVRAVRAGPPPQPSYVDHGDGTVTDRATGLMWQKCSYGQTWGDGLCSGPATSRTWQQALEAAETLSWAGYTDWRLPNRNELQSLVDYTRGNPAIHPDFPSPSSHYWSSTTLASSTIDASFVSFNDGGVNADYKPGSHYSYYVRAVRAGKSGSFGNLAITIEPEDARNEGAQWRRLGTSTWRDSGTTESGVPAGGHVVEYKEVSGWTRPANQNVTITDGQTTTETGTYTTAPTTGSLQVTIEPEGARTAGAQWRRVGTSTWRDSGDTESGVPAGGHIVEYKEISGWTRPANQNVTIADGQTTTATGTYTTASATGSLQVTIEPEGARTGGAQWRRTGTTTWFNSGATEADLPVGNYTVEFKTVSGYNAPANQSVTIQESQTTQTTGTYTPSTGPGSLKWSFRVNEPSDPYVRSSPALSADGSVAYFGANDGKVYAVNTADGSKKWEHETGGPVRSSPAVDASGTVYVGSNDGKVYKLNPDNGSLVTPWPVTTGGNVWSSPAIAVIGSETKVFIGSNDGVVRRINMSAVAEWSASSHGNPPFLSSPAIFNGYMYIGDATGELFAYSVSEDGDPKENFPFPASWIIYSSPAIGADGTIYFATTDGKVYAVNPNGSQKWVRSLGETFVFSSPVLGAVYLYIGCNEGKLHKLDMHTGTPPEVGWPYQTGGPIMSTPALSGPVDPPDETIIYVGSYDGKLHAVNPDGTESWTYTTGGPIYASPAIGTDGTVYVGSHDGYFYAIAGEYPLADTAWPKFRGDAQNTGRLP